MYENKLNIKFDFCKWVKKSCGVEKIKMPKHVVNILHHNTTNVDFYMLTTLFITRL